MKAFHKNNLRKLSAYLKTLPDSYNQFNMKDYMAHPTIMNPFNGTLEYTAIDIAETECGTVACAIGHGPAAGIENEPDETWGTYCERVFGARPNSSFDAEGAYDYMFSHYWADVDNTPKGAAARIDEVLRSGVPKKWDYSKFKIQEDYDDEDYYDYEY